MHQARDVGPALVLGVRSSRYERLCLFRCWDYDDIEFDRCVVPLGVTLAHVSGALLDHILVSSRDGRRGLQGELCCLVYHLACLNLLPIRRQRENLLRQIREKNETISLLLNQLRNTNLTTPISINAARIPLSAAERERHGEVLSWMERRHAVSTQASEKACVAYDTSQLEDEDMYSSSEDEDENYEDAQEKAVARMRGDASAFFSPVIAALPEQGTLGFLAAFSSQFNRSPSPLGADVFGIANKRYFQPSGSSRIIILWLVSDLR
jgi:hypothetical protein